VGRIERLADFGIASLSMRDSGLRTRRDQGRHAWKAQFICSRKVPGTLNSCNNQNCFSPMGVDTCVKKGGCYETPSPRSVGDCGCGSANISERAVRANLHAHAGIGGTRGSARAFATTRTHYRRDHAFLTTGIDGRRVRVAMSKFAM
jgi:hypothetical protein